MTIMITEGLVVLFYFLEKESERESKGTGQGQRWRERERERISCRLQAEHRTQNRAWSRDPGIMT